MAVKCTKSFFTATTDMYRKSIRKIPTPRVTQFFGKPQRESSKRWVTEFPKCTPQQKLICLVTTTTTGPSGIVEPCYIIALREITKKKFPPVTMDGHKQRRMEAWRIKLTSCFLLLPRRHWKKSSSSAFLSFSFHVQEKSFSSVEWKIILAWWALKTRWFIIHAWKCEVNNNNGALSFVKFLSLPRKTFSLLSDMTGKLESIFECKNVRRSVSVEHLKPQQVREV